MTRTDVGHPEPPKLRFEQVIQSTATTPKSVYVALRDAWDSARMGGPASPKAVVVLLAQWHIETEAGAHCYNWNLAGMKCPHPESQLHFYMDTMEDYPAAEARAMVAARRAYFKEDKDLAVAGKLRVWLGKGCFRAWYSLPDGAAGYLGVLSGAYRTALPHVLAGDPENFVHDISEEVRGKNKGWFTGPDAIYRDGKPWSGYRFVMRRLWREYMAMDPARW